jgi:hypothetical protein
MLVVVTPGPHLWRTAGDVSQTNQVLMNLVVNARDAMHGGGRIDIATENLTVTGAGAHPRDIVPGEYVVLTVTDTGAGMTAETRQHIFEPFFSTKGEAGTGLGLSTVYGIVKQSGGFIWISSEPGQGTTFTIHMPPTLAIPAATETPQPAARRATQHATILLTEDDPDVHHCARGRGRGLSDSINPSRETTTTRRAPTSTSRIHSSSSGCSNERPSAASITTASTEGYICTSTTVPTGPSGALTSAPTRSQR